MKFIGISLIILSGVILIVSLVYIITINRTKERLAMMEKNMDPNLYQSNHFLSNTLKIGLLFMGAGLGFITALIVDEYVIVEVDNPAIYAGSVLFFAGTGLILFHKFFKEQKS